MTIESLLMPVLLAVAAFLAGVLNAIAGGGSFLTLPALVYSGVPAVAANASGTLALLPGYLAAAWGFRHDIRPLAQLSLRALIVISCVGGAAGAALLIVTPGQLFRGLVPWLLLFATAAFVVGPRLAGARRRGGEAGWLACAAGVALVTLYGGYFNGGLGIMLLALFGLLGQTDLNAMNGLKNLVSAVLTAIAVVVYVYGGTIVWAEALMMMAAATAGGYLGARWARRLSRTALRWVVVVTGLLMTLLFLLA